jgi:cytochrome c553
MMMKSLILFAAAGAALALAAANGAIAQPAPDGAALFDARCKICHEGGSAPSKATLASHTPAQIVDILTNGVMAPMAGGLSDAEKQAIAAHITAGAAPAPPTTPTAPAAPGSTTPATPAPAPQG